MISRYTAVTSLGATAVQIVHSSRRGARDIEHIGSARDEAELEILKAAARQRMSASQGELDLDLGTGTDAVGTGGGSLAPLPPLVRRHQVTDLGPQPKEELLHQPPQGQRVGRRRPRPPKCCSDNS